MNTHSLHVLEFPKILGFLTSHCCTAWFGPELHLGYEDRFFPEESRARECLTMVDLVSKLLVHPDFPGVGQIQDFRGLLGQIKVEGAVADLERIGDLLPGLKNAVNLGRWADPQLLEDELSLSPGPAQLLGGLFQGLSGYKELLRFLYRYIDDSGRLKEDQIPELVQIQKQIQRINQDIVVTARGIISQQGSFFSSDTPVFREGRVLLPLKADYKGRIEGLFHGASESGGTIYIEPGSLLTHNNGLNEAKAAYSREIHRILRLISAELRKNLDQLEQLFHFWNDFDGYYIRARWMITTASTIPEFTQGDCALVKVRHPLLGKSAIPLDLRFLPDKRIILISGPNTGGKTVAMKTLGLMVLLSQFGVPLPAAEGSKLPWFNGVFADIGDEQSIEENLSTFSAHLKNIAAIMNEAKPGSLVLMDELGTGTDPQEGGALGLAIIEKLIEKQTYSFITSHHSSLKAYAYSHGAMENASMEFDSQNKIPTYTIRYGIPGASRALEIAQGVGFPPDVLHRAHEFLDSSANPLEKLIESIGEKERMLDSLIHDQQKLRNELTNGTRDLEQKQEEFQKQLARHKQDKLQQVNAYLAESRKTIEKAMADFQASAKALLEGSSDEAQKARQDLQDLRQVMIQQTSHFEQESEDTKRQMKKLAHKRVVQLKPGLEVQVEGTTQKGTLVKQVKDGKWIVAAGMVKLTLDAHTLVPIQTDGGGKRFFVPEKEHKKYFRPVEHEAVAVGSSGAAPRFTLDVRGQRLEEAVKNVQEQIEGAAVHGLDFFAIIHGKGTGILQAGIHEHLKNHSFVQDFHFARPEDGGTGKTLVYLRRN